MLRNHLQRAAVDGRTAHDFVSGLEQAEQRRRGRRHAGGREKRRLAALERRHFLLHGLHGGVRVARIDVPVPLALLVGLELRGTGEQKRARCVNRRRQRRRIGPRAIARVQGFCDWMLRHDRPSSLSPFNLPLTCDL